MHPLQGQPSGKLPAPFLIVPQPQDLELLDGTGLSSLANLRISDGVKRPVMGHLLSQLVEAAGIGGGVLTLRLDSSALVPASPEGYVLTISNGQAGIVARGQQGIFYGCQTLEQLLEDARDFNKPIPACKITDFPALGYRAVHFDVKHHLDQMNYYYESIDRLARYKINAVIFEFEDKLRYRRQPLVGAPQAISIDEMAALTNYARERHIEISPLVQGLGHATFILKHKHYEHLRELKDNRWAFCPKDEGTYEVLFDLYRDAIEATPGAKYLHIGGDEVGNIGLCERCNPTGSEEGKLGLNLYWLKRVCDFANANGRTPIFWDDMPLKEAGLYKSTSKSSIGFDEAKKIWELGSPKLEEVISDFPKNCVYMRWNYSKARQPGNIFALDWYQKHGLQSMISTAAVCGPAALFPFDDRGGDMASHGIPAIQSFIQLAAEKGIGGMLCSAWDDRSAHMETHWRGLIASAEYSWSPNGRTLDEYDEAYLQREYGTTVSNYADIYGMLRKAAVFWGGVFNRQGSRMDVENALFNLPGLAHWMPPRDKAAPIRADFTGLLIELPDLGEPGSWSKKYGERLTEAESILKEYKYTSYVLDSLYKTSKRNRYHWELFSVINNFQVTAPHLLLALKQCDTADKGLQLEGAEKVKQAVNGFNEAWQQLKTTYGKTRFISYPVNYVPDRYYHFASQREDLSWMIQVEELFHKMVDNWITKNNLN
ncbi:MAG: family 20 glycosylhydrolase [Chlorobi bacterium]|nr:family 20 glycosylhydrolase [Chlorobiota bacterium]